MKNIKVAICQNFPVKNIDDSVKKISEMIETAAKSGAELVLLPEIFYAPYSLQTIPKIEDSGHLILNKMKNLAMQNSIYLCLGSIVEREGGCRFNKSYLISPLGDILLEHRKVHLYDVDFKELKTKESKVFDPGNSFNVVDTPFGKIGILICYDIRFPEAMRCLAVKGAEIVLVPAAFNTISGTAHWSIFFRTRAVENQLYVLAASPARDSNALYKAYGHSFIIDPWGGVMTEAGIDEEIIYANLSGDYLEEIRSRLPLLKHRKPESYI